MTDEMRVKAAEPDAYQHTNGYIFSRRASGSVFFDISWEEATGHSTVLKFWNKEALKIECHGAPHGDALIGDYCWEGNDVESRYICPERIKAAEAAWEREHAAEICTGCSSSISRCVCKQEPSDELSRLRKENEELKAALEAARELAEKATEAKQQIG